MPLLEADRRSELDARALLRALQQRHPGEYTEGQLRTLQRRVSEWRALHGPAQEVYFPQVHPPGRQGSFDFTNCNELDVTINGVLFAHLLFEFVLSFSGWRSGDPIGKLVPGNSRVGWGKFRGIRSVSWSLAAVGNDSGRFIDEKQALLDKLAALDGWAFFVHDPEVAVARRQRD